MGGARSLRPRGSGDPAYATTHGDHVVSALRQEPSSGQRLLRRLDADHQQALQAPLAGGFDDVMASSARARPRLIGPGSGIRLRSETPEFRGDKRECRDTKSLKMLRFRSVSRVSFTPRMLPTKKDNRIGGVEFGTHSSRIPRLVPSIGRLAQRKSGCFTRSGSAVRSRHRPPHPQRLF